MTLPDTAFAIPLPDSVLVDSATVAMRRPDDFTLWLMSHPGIVYAVLGVAFLWGCWMVWRSIREDF